MDTRSRTASRLTRLTAAAIAATACIVFFGPTAHSHTGPATTVVHGGTAAQRQAIDWALGRFREAGLPDLPALEVSLLGNGEGCRGNMGFYRDGRIDLCTSESSEPYGRKFALHEMAHAWTDAHLDADLERRFMGLRGIDGWTDRSLEWKQRGFEQAAEIIAWGLGEGEIRPLLPEQEIVNEELAAAYVLLTGSLPINGLV